MSTQNSSPRVVRNGTKQAGLGYKTMDYFAGQSIALKRKPHTHIECIQAVAELQKCRYTSGQIAQMLCQKLSWVERYDRLARLDPVLQEQLAFRGQRNRLRTSARLPVVLALQISRLPRSEQCQAMASIFHPSKSIFLMIEEVRLLLQNRKVNKPISTELEMRKFIRDLEWVKSLLSEYVDMSPGHWVEGRLIESLAYVHMLETVTVIEQLAHQLKKITELSQPNPKTWHQKLQVWLAQEVEKWQESGLPIIAWMDTESVYRKPETGECT